MRMINSNNYRSIPSKNLYSIFFNSYRLLSKRPQVKISTKNADQTEKIIWYPGHIAKAEKELANQIKLVDVVLEVRDARILSSTTHPLVPKWVGNRPVFVVISRMDQVTQRCIIDWKAYYSRHPPYQNSKIFFIDGTRGGGIEKLRTQILKAGVGINEKRAKLGIEPRPVRAAVIGYPNVGKSSLINRILNRKLAPVQNVAGFTKTLRWVRVGDKDIQSQKHGIELLDSPGIIPPRINDQNNAMALAICNDIGKASYDKFKAAVSLCNRVIAISKERKGYVSIPSITSRYNISFDGNLTGEKIVNLYAEKHFHSEETQAAEKLLGDFRKGYWGLAALEYPPNIDLIDREKEEKKENNNLNIENKKEFNKKQNNQISEIVKNDHIDEELEIIESNDNSNDNDNNNDNHSNDNDNNNSDIKSTILDSKNTSKERFIVGSSDKGSFDGW